MINHQVLEQLVELEKDDDLAENLISDCIKSFEEYHKAVYEHESTRRILAHTFNNTADYQTEIGRLDHKRTLCHNSIIANVDILNRMAKNNNLPLIYDGIVSEEQPYRRELANAVFEYIEWLINTRI